MRIPKITTIVTSVFLLISITSCGPTIYLAPGAMLKVSKHNVLAILPPSVSIPASKNVTAEAMRAQQKTESVNFQTEIYKSFLKRVRQGRMTVQLQDIEETNVLIKRNFPEGNYTTKELCAALGVDAVMDGKFSLSKPMSQGAAIAAAVLFGGIGATNEVGVNLSVKDCSSKELLWNYDWRYKGGLGSSTEDLVESLMRNASNKIPYTR